MPLVVEHAHERVGERVTIAARHHQRFAAIFDDVAEAEDVGAHDGVSHAIDSSSVMPNDAFVVGQA